MIEPGRIVPMYGPLLGGRRQGVDVLGRGGSLTVDELAVRLLQELGREPADEEVAEELAHQYADLRMAA